MDLELSNHVVIVTGASKGIGLATVERLSAEGAHVVAVSRRPSPELDRLGSSVRHLSIDLTEASGPDRVVARTLEQLGRIDAVINNAGGPPPGTSMPVFGFLGRTDEHWQRMIDFNLLSVVRMCRAALPSMVERAAGVIINVGSTHALTPSAVNVDYGAAKAALRNLTKALAEEFGPQGVRVNSVTPGPVLTPWWTDPGGAAELLAEVSDQSAEQVINEVVPTQLGMTTGRLARPEEIADTIALLCSARSASTTGADFVIDGGSVKTA